MSDSQTCQKPSSRAKFQTVETRGRRLPKQSQKQYRSTSYLSLQTTRLLFFPPNRTSPATSALQRAQNTSKSLVNVNARAMSLQENPDLLLKHVETWNMLKDLETWHDILWNLKNHLNSLSLWNNPRSTEASKGAWNISVFQWPVHAATNSSFNRACRKKIQFHRLFYFICVVAYCGVLLLYCDCYVMYCIYMCICFCLCICVCICMCICSCIA